MSIKVLLIGATGYIGGAVLRRLVDLDLYTITVTARKQEQADKLKTLGVHPVIASLDDAELLIKLSSEADIVVDMASALHPTVAVSFISGLAQRKVSTGKETHYIRTSGSSILGDRANGEFKSDRIYSDTEDIYAIEASDSAYPVRIADIATVDAGLKEGVKTYIVTPPTIYGIGDGLFHKTSQQVPGTILAAIKYQRAQHVGQGLSVWSHVSISDTASLYVLLISKALANEAPSGKAGYYFLETGEHSWKELVEAIAQVLSKREGVTLESTETAPFESLQEVADLFAGGSLELVQAGLGSNSRIRGTRSRELGWNPVDPPHAIYDSIPAEVDFILNGQH